MLRRSITFLRERGLANVLPLDQHVYLHKVVGTVIAFLSIFHGAMHTCNFGNYPMTVAQWQTGWWMDFSLVFNVADRWVIDGRTYSISEWLFTTKPGVYGLIPGVANITGWALLIIALIISISSLPFVRKGGNFEVPHSVSSLSFPPPSWVASLDSLRFRLSLNTRYFAGCIASAYPSGSSWFSTRKTFGYGCWCPARFTCWKSFGASCKSCRAKARPLSVRPGCCPRASPPWSSSDPRTLIITRVTTSSSTCRQSPPPSGTRSPSAAPPNSKVVPPFPSHSEPITSRRFVHGHFSCSVADSISLHIRGVGGWTNRLYQFFENQQQHLSHDVCDYKDR